ncbi:hypothetical protein ON010_g17743 [Phytophthora cinnamomi]|nr:hypothetical protein ON010_g17743 [Phytophthora cinnamomi]
MTGPRYFHHLSVELSCARAAIAALSNELALLNSQILIRHASRCGALEAAAAACGVRCRCRRAVERLDVRLHLRQLEHVQLVVFVLVVQVAVRDLPRHGRLLRGLQRGRRPVLPLVAGLVRTAAARAARPAADTCANDSNYACTCQHKSDRPSYWIWIGLGVFAVGALIGGGIFMAMRKRRMQQRRDEYPPQAAVAYTQPVYAPGGYAQQGYAAGQPVYAAQPTYVQPGYYGQGGYRDGYRGGRRGMGTGGAVAMGAAGGLLGGLLIGEALGDMGDGGGGDFGGGGGDFGGDF